MRAPAIENRNELVVDAELVMASGTAERYAAVQMAERVEGDWRVTRSTPIVLAAAPSTNV